MISCLGLRLTGSTKTTKQKVCWPLLLLQIQILLLLLLMLWLVAVWVVLQLLPSLRGYGLLNACCITMTLWVIICVLSYIWLQLMPCLCVWHACLLLGLLCRRLLWLYWFALVCAKQVRSCA